MTAQELLKNLNDKKESMLIRTGQMSVLKDGITREQMQKVYIAIQIIETAKSNFYYPKYHINRISIADHWIKQIESGFNRYSFSGKSKDVKLSNGTEEIIIRDRIAKDFIILFLEQDF
jgi:hypothetical protein